MPFGQGKFGIPTIIDFLLKMFCSFFQVFLAKMLCNFAIAKHLKIGPGACQLERYSIWPVNIRIN
jgi:hypothetical protein